MSEKAATPAAKDPVVIVHQWLARSERQMTAAIPKGLFTADRQIRLALTCLRRQPELLPNIVSREGLQSFLGAVMSASQLGLELDGLLGQAWPVPFKGKVQLVIGYKGHITLAMRSGQVKSIDAHLVYANDEFSMAHGTNQHLHHVPMLAPIEERGDLMGAYAIAHLVTEGSVFEVMSIAEIEEIEKEFSKAKKGPWHEVIPRRQMIRKTPIRRLSNYLPLSPEQQRAVTLDEMAGQGIDQKLEDVPFEPEFTPLGPEGIPPADTKGNDPAAKTEETIDTLKNQRSDGEPQTPLPEDRGQEGGTRNLFKKQKKGDDS